MSLETTPHFYFLFQINNTAAIRTISFIHSCIPLANQTITVNPIPFEYGTTITTSNKQSVTEKTGKLIPPYGISLLKTLVLIRNADIINMEFHNSAMFYGYLWQKEKHKGIISTSYWSVTELITNTLAPIAAYLF